MTIKTLNKIKINGIGFEELTGRLCMDNEDYHPIIEQVGTREPIMTGWHQPQHELELFPDNPATSDCALILYGFVQSLLTYNYQNKKSSPLYIHIIGVDTEKPWVTYSGKFWITDWSFEGNRMERVGLRCQDAINIVIDTENLPKLQPSLTEKETAVIIASLIREKSANNPNTKETADRAIKHLQKVMKESNMERCNND